MSGAVREERHTVERVVFVSLLRRQLDVRVSELDFGEHRSLSADERHHLVCYYYYYSFFSIVGIVIVCR